MSELTVTLLRLGYLALLWVFVLTAISVLRRDLYGTKITTRRTRSRTRSAPAIPPAAPSEVVDRHLVVTSGPLRGTTLPLGSAPVLIGRSPACTLVLDDDYSSSRHARIFLEQGQWYVEDLGSTNGTFVGKQRVTSPAPVDVGSQIRVGQSVIELRR